MLRDPNAIYWHYPHYHSQGSTPHSAIRAGDWRLVEFFEDSHAELYNLKEDIGEANDLAAEVPQKVAELKAKLAAWREKVGAQMPTENPNYDPKKTSGRFRAATVRERSAARTRLIRQRPRSPFWLRLVRAREGS